METIYSSSVARNGYFAELELAYMEDDEPAREEIKNGLEARGFTIKCITGYRDALDFAKRSANKRYPAFVLDINMGPGMTTEGLKISRKLKTLFSGSLVILSSKLSEINAAQIMSAGADEVLTKETIELDVRAIAEKALSWCKTQNLDISKPTNAVLSDTQYARESRDDSNISINTDHSVVPKEAIISLGGTFPSQDIFSIYCSANDPSERFFSKINDRFVSRSVIEQSLATKLITLSVISKQPHELKHLETFLVDFSTIDIRIPMLAPLSEHEKGNISPMVLHTKTGALHSFGSLTKFDNAELVVQPGIMDLLDPCCEESIVEHSALITVDIQCIIFGVYY